MFKSKIDVAPEVRASKEDFNEFLQKAKELSALADKISNGNGGIYIKLVGNSYRSVANEALRNAMDFDFLYNYPSIQKNPNLAIEMAETTSLLKEFNKVCKKRRKNMQSKRKINKGNKENEVKKDQE